MNGRDCIDDYDVLCCSLLLGGKPGVNSIVRTRWSQDNLVEPRQSGNKSMARRLRRCLNIPDGFTGTICFSFYNSRLSGPPWIDRLDGGRYIQLR